MPAPICSVASTSQPNAKKRRGRKSAFPMVIGAVLLGALLALQRKTTEPAGVVRRARAVILLAQGEGYASTARKVGLAERHVHKWARRIVEQGLPGLEDRPRPGRKPVFDPPVALHLVKMACEMPDL